MFKANCFCLLFFLFHLTISKATDTLFVNLRQADSIFLVRNYRLLAVSMNIDIQKAQVIQAKLYPNPVVTIDVNAWDPQNNKVFHDGKTGQKSFQYDQLILLGGKRQAQMDLARTNTEIAELEFQDLIRQLKYQLHSSLYNLSQQAFLISKYNYQLDILDSILSAYEVQVIKGNIPLKDQVRLKGVYLNLSNSRAEVYKRYYEELGVVQTILQTSTEVKPLISDEDFKACIKPVSLTELNDAALQNRPDYLISEKNKVLAEQYFRFQKKMSVPDINLFTSYDQRGGAFVNQVNIGVSLPLRLWNRNQGNIRSAAFLIRQNEYNAEAMKNELLAEIQRNYALFNQSIKEYNKVSFLYNSDFELTLKGMSDNFKKRNVSLLEFVDFFESYNNALAEIARIKMQLATSAEELNYNTGKQIF
jgi:cobalt-zinc-cadmium efflux system outer membrane protein